MIDPANVDYTNTPASAQRPAFGYAPADGAAPPAVSIVTPVYNIGPILRETARTVVGQSLQQWEWLIVNDGSSDPETLTILAEYRQSDPRIRVIDHEQNKGISAARNTGYQAARAGVVVQLDGDDLLEPTAIEKWLWFLTSYPEYGFANSYSLGFGARTYLWRGGFQRERAFLQQNQISPNAMVRKDVHAAVGGYDESLRQGLEDWEFWLRCAAAGHWGGTIAEHLVWYRRRASHGDHWPNLQGPAQIAAFRDQVLRRRYPRLWEENGFPQIQPHPHRAYDPLPDALPCANLLHKDRPRLLLIAPWLRWGGADQFNLDLVHGLIGRGWNVSIAATGNDDHAWLPLFAAATPDIFILQRFLRLVDYPRFLRYLIASRQVDAVLVSNSDLGYQLLPYLRAHFPALPLLDYCHMEEEDWRHGGYPRMAIDYQELLDLSIVSSQHLKQWMVERGAQPDKVAVCHINVDTQRWQPDEQARAGVRRELALHESIPLILYAARLTPQKQPQVLAKTLLSLRRQGVSFAAAVAGDGPQMEWLRAFVRRQGLAAQVRLPGAVSQERMRQLLAAADIFFLPSQMEGIALSIYEAMACGLAVVGADVGGQRELVTPECGVLVGRAGEEDEAAQYAAILADLLRNPQRRQAMGDAGRARVSAHFRLEQMVDGMSFLLAEAQQRRATPAQPAPSLALGAICAIQAIEHQRLINIRQQALSAEKTRRTPTQWIAAVHHRLASIMPGAKRFIPTRVKVFIKKTVR